MTECGPDYYLAAPQCRHSRGNQTMPSKDYFRNLAQMSRRIASNMTDPAIVERLEAIGAEYDLQAEQASDSDPSENLAPLRRRGQASSERT